ncbi:CHAD domain-containing protein, partial [Streptomyces resistomycificus]|uniref:CHAD domain-containing protein n=1 Tax=Streptomyces resistomycificus TaxID=67356 RepID=UPI001CEDF9DC
MAQQHLDPTDPVAGTVTGDALAGYLRSQATEFLRALRLHRETGGTAAGTEDSVDAARALRRSVRRVSGSLHTFRPLLDPEWSESLRPELAWLSGTLGMEHAYASRLDRLLQALHRLSGTPFPTQPAAGPTTGTRSGTGTVTGTGARTAAGSGGGRSASGGGGERSASGSGSGMPATGGAAGTSALGSAAGRPASDDRTGGSALAGEATGSATGSAAGRPTPGDQTSTSAPTGEATGSVSYTH